MRPLGRLAFEVDWRFKCQCPADDSVQLGTVCRAGSGYARDVAAIQLADEAERLTRIGQLIETYRAAKRRRILRRALKLWRATEVDQRLAEFEARPDRIH